MKRYARIVNARSRDELEAYLPGNYQVAGVIDNRDPDIPGGKLTFVISGEDNAGWTLDNYVIPRLASGLIFGEEIDLSHPLMKAVPTCARAK